MGQRLDRHLATETAAAPPQTQTPPTGADELQQQLRAQDRELQRVRGELEQLRQRLQETPKQTAVSPARISADPQPAGSPGQDRDGDGVTDARDLCPDTGHHDRRDATHRVSYGTPTDIEVIDCCGACVEAHFGTERLD